MDSMSSSYSSASEGSELDYTHHGLGSFNFPRPPSPQTQTHRTHPSIASTFSTSTYASNHSNNDSLHIPSRPQTPSEFQFACDTAAFIRMVRGHIQNVKDLKHRTSVMPSVRFNFPAEPPMVQKERGSRVYESANREYEKVDVESKRRERMSRTFRPRFDPEEIRRLCGEVEAELMDC
jgi:hypothetical protein